MATEPTPAFTPEQRQVLDADGKIIVSASAGSGKTFIMIERLIRKILSGADVDRILALTFTREAAAQMQDKTRRKIVSRINAKDASAADKERLRKQLARLPLAEITTIDAFCTRFVRSHFFLAEVDGNFEILTDEDPLADELQSRAIDAVFTEAYENEEEAFLRLLSVLYRKKDDPLKKIVVALHKKIRIRADYEEELDRIAAGQKTTAERTEQTLLELWKEDFTFYLEKFRALKEGFLTRGNAVMADYCEKMLGYIDGFLRRNDFFDAVSYAARELPRLKKPSRRQAEKDLLTAEVLTAAEEKTKCEILAETEAAETRAAIKKQAEDAACFADRTLERERFAGAERLSQALASYVKRYDEKYAELKRERAVLDYNDVEQLTLRLLKNESVQKEVRGRYDYVFVDEYQDVNPIQEEIVSRLSGENLFLVGDVKQAIYAFRGSKSVYFSQKEEQFRKEGYALRLTSNFRSGKAVLDVVNRVFSRIMTEESCGIDYQSRPMQGGEKYGEHAGRVILHLLPEPPKSEEEEERARGVYSVLNAYDEAKEKRTDDWRGHKVFDIVQNELCSEIFDVDKGAFRKVTYADILILYRSSSEKFSSVVAYLVENGVPVSSETQVNLFDYSEIRQLTDVLSYLDNPEQDVALCSALLSAMGGFTNEELAAVRLTGVDRRKPFRAAVKAYSVRTGSALAEKLRAFYRRADRYAALSRVLSCGELIARLIAETGMETQWLAKPDGPKRRERVAFYMRQADGKTLHEFLSELKHLGYRIRFQERGGENAVRVMSMHQCKGLEYPVVILPEADKLFHGREKAEVLYSEKYGFASLCFDEKTHHKYRTTLYELVQREARRENLGSELNLLYVAMTRAKFALHLVMEKPKKQADTPLFSKGFADLLPLDCFEEKDESAPVGEPFENRNALPALARPPLADEIQEQLRFVYPFRGATTLPVKSSASEMMRERGEKEYYDVRPLVEEMEEGETEKGVKKSEIGTAYHAFLEHAVFGRDGGEEYDRMAKEQTLPSAQFGLLKRETAKRILGMPLFLRLQGATLSREQPFLVSLPASAFFDTTETEEMLFQGFIDLLAVTPAGVEIVDYKYSSADGERIRRHYAPQIALYKKAVAKIMGIEERTIRATIVNIERGEEILF